MEPEQPRPLEVGDAFTMNGHFACVTHVNMERPPTGLALVSVFADPNIYGMHAPHVLALRDAFERFIGRRHG